MRAKLSIVLGAIAAICIIFVDPGRSAPQLPISKFMRQKLEHSQKVLEGLALEDYDLIAENAESLAVLSQAAGWQVLKTPEYAQHSTEFLRLAKQLGEMAEKKNLDGAAFTYVQLTINCVNCHKYVRTVRTAQLHPHPLVPSGMVVMK